MPPGCCSVVVGVIVAKGKAEAVALGEVDGLGVVPGTKMTSGVGLGVGVGAKITKLAAATTAAFGPTAVTPTGSVPIGELTLAVMVIVVEPLVCGESESTGWAKLAIQFEYGRIAESEKLALSQLLSSLLVTLTV